MLLINSSNYIGLPWWAHAQEVAGAVSSVLAQGKVEVQQSCFLPLSPDGLPVVGAVAGIDGAFIASGKLPVHWCMFMFIIALKFV